MCIRSGELVIISRFRGISRFFSSLRFRIMLLLLITGLIPCLVLKWGMISNYESRAQMLRIQDIQKQCGSLANQIAASDYMDDPTDEVVNAELELIAQIVHSGRIRIVDENLVVIKDTLELDESKTLIVDEVVRGLRGEASERYNDKEDYIEITYPIVYTTEEEEYISGVMLVRVATDNIRDSVTEFNYKANVLLMMIGLVVLILAFIFSAVLVRPFGKLTKSIEALTDGYQDDSIPEAGYTETRLVSETFNKLLARMKVLDDSRQEFVSNVSHELKTPLTSMKVLADSLLAQEDVPAELYKEFMVDIADEIDRENDIISDLLALVKMDKKATDLNVKNLNINELLELILKRLRPIAEKRNVELVFESFRPVTAEGDEVKLTLAFSNLVENAIKYNKESGWVHVSLNADHKYFYVKVADSGVGIPEEDTEHIFERFYRVDKSHSREIGGTGLGLAIARNAILMHRGAIKVYSKEGEGTTFTVRVPLNYIH